MKRTLQISAVLLTLAVLVSTSAAFAGHGLLYHAFVTLDGAQEVPGVQTGNAGHCAVSIIPADEFLTVSCVFSTAPTAAHIHIGSIGVNGPVMIPLTPGRIIQESFTVTEEQQTALMLSDAYINFHSDAFPGGELRGQIEFVPVPGTLRMNADGSGADEETPNSAPNSIQCSVVGATGSPNILSVQCLHDVTDATAAHLHRAAAGIAGPVVEGFESAASPLEAIFQVDDATWNDFLAGSLYVNVHNATFPGGIVRAQLDNAIDGDNSLALQDGRFNVSVTGSTPFGSFTGRAHRSSDVSGSFSFFDTSNVEQTIKILNFCGEPGDGEGALGVFIASTTDVQFDLVVTDTQSGETMTYSNPQGNIAQSEIDFDSFRTCP